MRYYSSIAQLAALTTAVDSSATTMIVSTVAGWPLTCPFTVVVDDSTLSEEIVTVTAVAGTTLTVVRAQDGSAGVSHSVGATVRHMVTARDLREPQEHMLRSAEVHGLDYMSDVVGTNATQALSNKTIHGYQNTIDEIDQASVINLLTDLGNLYGYTKLAGNTLRATAYNAGDVIVRPDGTLWKAKVYFICTGTFNVADWDPVAVPIFPVTTQAARDALPAGTATKPTYADCLYDGTLQRNVGSGWAVLTGGPVCRLTTSVPSMSAPATTATFAAVYFNLETYDPTNMHDNVTNSTRITIAVPGYYRVKGKLRYNSGTALGVALAVNGTQIPETQTYVPFPTSAYADPSVDTTIYLAAGQYVELLTGSVPGGAAINSSGCYFEAAFVRS